MDNNTKNDDPDEGITINKKLIEKLYKEKNMEHLKFDKETIEKLVDRLDKQNERKWEKFFIPTLILFAIISVLAYGVIYSITQDMSKLANAMDPKMSYNMDTMSKSVLNLSENIVLMTKSVQTMSENLSLMQSDLSYIAKTMDPLKDSVESISVDIRVLSPMLKNMHAMNTILVQLEKSMSSINNSVGKMTYNFDKSMSFMPF